MGDEIKDTGGRLAANFRKANLAEGLAIQMFRPFSAIAPVPREEDFGIDFIATLIRKDGKVLVAEDSFLLQVKTSTAPYFKFSGEGITWLKSLRLPYFPVVVDLVNGSISIYTLNQYHFPLYASAVNVYNFCVQNESYEGDGLDDFPLDDPIMTWNLIDCVHEEFPRWAYTILKRIIPIESKNFINGWMRTFEEIEYETYVFSPENPAIDKFPTTKTFDSPPGDKQIIENNLKTVITPFAYSIENQIFDEDKSKYILQLRDTLRNLDFDPDPDNKWDEIAENMSRYFNK